MKGTICFGWWMNVALLALSACGQTDVTGPHPNDAQDWVAIDLSTFDAAEDAVGDGADTGQACVNTAACLESMNITSCETVACVAGACVVEEKELGSGCDDGDLCTLDDLCTETGCVGTVTECGDGEPCHPLECDPATGECASTDSEDGVSCDDLDPCTVEDTCSAGSCIGADKDCSTGDSCQIGQCNAEDGSCDVTVLEDDVVCEDGDLCTQGDLCLDGACQSGGYLMCEQGLLCMTFDCDPQTGECAGQAHDDGSVCDDGLVCTVEDQCVAGLCVSQPRVCDPSEEQEVIGDPSLFFGSCNSGTCSEEGGGCLWDSSQFEGDLCDDGLFCSLSTACAQGGCAATESMECDDNDPCTQDLCLNEADGEQGLGCSFTPFGTGSACPYMADIPCYGDGFCSDLDDGSFGCTANWDPLLPGCSEGDSCYAPVVASSENVSLFMDTEEDSLKSDSVQLDDCPGIFPDFPPLDGIADVIVEFTAPSDGIYRFEVQATDGSFDSVLGLYDACPGTPDATCVAGEDVIGPGGESIVRLMHAGDVLYAVIDGYMDTGSFQFTAVKTASYEFECADLTELGAPIDNDADGLPNCLDPDCALALNCINQGDSCLKPNEIILDLSGTNTTIGDTSNFSDSAQDTGCQYGGNSGAGGNDIVHEFTATKSGTYRFSLTTDLDENGPWDSVLYLADSCPVAPDNCIESADQLPGSVEELEREMLQGDTVFAVVDAWKNNFTPPVAGVFELSVSLVEAKELLCADGVDDDGDNAIDCLDSDCEGTLACPTQGSICENPFTISALPFFVTGNTATNNNNFTHGTSPCPDANNPGGLLPSEGGGNDVVYLLEPSEDMTVHIYLESTVDTFDSVLVVYQDSCPGQENVQCLSGADLNLPGGEEITVAVQAGAQYFIVVDGYAASSFGNYYLHVDEVDP